MPAMVKNSSYPTLTFPGEVELGNSHPFCSSLQWSLLLHFCSFGWRSHSLKSCLIFLSMTWQQCTLEKVLRDQAPVTVLVAMRSPLIKLHYILNKKFLLKKHKMVIYWSTDSKSCDLRLTVSTNSVLVALYRSQLPQVTNQLHLSSADEIYQSHP